MAVAVHQGRATGFGLGTIQTEAKRKPHKIVLYAPGGWGKTSLAAQFPKTLFLTTSGENGLVKLVAEGQVPAVPRVENANGDTPAVWADVRDVVRDLREADHDYRYLAIDTGNGLEEMLRQEVCETEFHGDWSEKGFMSFHRGYKITAERWREFLTNELEPINAKRNVGIIMLCHSKVTDFKNPMGKDYSTYAPNMHDAIVGNTYQWADMVWFGGWRVSAEYADEGDKKATAQGGKARMLYTSQRPAYYAKSRVGVPDELEMGKTPEESYRVLCDALKGATKHAAQS